MDGLHGGDHAGFRRQHEVLVMEQLQVLDAIGERWWCSEVVQPGHRLQGVMVGQIADGVDGETDAPGSGECSGVGNGLDIEQKLAAIARVVIVVLNHRRSTWPQRSVGEELEVADPQPVVAEPTAQAEIKRGAEGVQLEMLEDS